MCVLLVVGQSVVEDNIMTTTIIDTNNGYIECFNCNGVLEFIIPDDWHWNIEYCPFCGSEDFEADLRRLESEQGEFGDGED